MSKHLKGQDAVVVFSGGQDSTTCLGWAIEKFNRVVALSFNYGQKHSIELQQASKIAKDLGVEHYVMDVSLLNQLAPNALTRTDIEVVNGKDVKDGEEPNTVVRGRNGLFLWLASIYASTHGIENVVTGVCETDFSGYIDCRDVFIKSLNVAIGLGMDDKITSQLIGYFSGYFRVGNVIAKQAGDVGVYENGGVGENGGGCYVDLEWNSIELEPINKREFELKNY